MIAQFESLESLSFAVTVAESSWIFPTLEVLHVLGLALLVGSIAVFDLRTLGLAWLTRPLPNLLREILPWTWIGFILAFVTGLLLFSSSASIYVENTAFLWKIGLIVLAGANALFFHFHPDHARLATDGQVSFSLRIGAGLSLTLWTAIVVFGRWIGFV